MADAGYIILFVALVAAIFSGAAFAIGAWKNLPIVVQSARYGIMAVFGFISLAVAILVYALITNDFQIEYVSSYTSTDLSLSYRMVSLWAGSAGSLLVWAWILALFALLVVIKRRHNVQEMVLSASAIIMIVEAFFLVLLVSVANPFVKLPVAPTEGIGLSPALGNPAMIIHPPLLLGGYAASAIPFAFVVAGLITKKMGTEWASVIRKWALLVWLLIGMGTIVGAWWAYVELGWGGYWVWDPLENSGLMPWLVLTAFLHTIPLYKRKRMLGTWNVSLIISVFFLTILGTFLTRSGIAHSVHAYAQSGQGPFFMVLMLVILIGPPILVILRRHELKSQAKIESLFSRESLNFVTSLILVVSAYLVFIGTIIPVIAGVIWKTRVNIGAEYFNITNGPIYAVIILLMGVCVFTGKRLATEKSFIRNFLPPIAVAFTVGIVLFLLGIHNSLALTGFILCSFGISAIVFGWSLEVRKKGARGCNCIKTSWNLLLSQRTHYGAYIVHIAIILIAIGVIGSSFYSTTTKASLLPGESTVIGKYTVEYEGVVATDVPDAGSNAAVMLYHKDELIEGLMPGIYFSGKSGRMYAEVAIHSTPVEDVYIILTGIEDDGGASFDISVKPLVMWLWIGAVVLLVGGLLCFSARTRVENEIS